MGNLTAFLILRNEELLLSRCLASLANVVDGIVALDTGSRDTTPAILSAAARDPDLPPLRWEHLVPFRDFGIARQAALDRVTTEWALWIDGDEEISPALRDRLREMRISGELDTRDAWEIRLDVYVYGRLMQGRNLSPQYQVRLFRSKLARITPSRVHEGVLLVPGIRQGRLEEPLRHDTLTSWRRYLRKVNHYTDLEATDPQRHFQAWHLLVTGPATLAREFIGRRGLRDGWPGFVWAATTAWSSVLRDWKLWRRQRHGSAAKERRRSEGDV